MKGKSKSLSILGMLLAVTIILGSFTACQSKTQTASSETSAVTSVVSVSAAQTEREITDMAGRKVTIPASIEKVYSSSPITAIYLYTISPEKLLGWNYDLNDLEKKYILPEYSALPSYGMGENVNYEAVIAAGPDIAVSVAKLNDASIEEADNLSDKLGIPVIIVDNDLLQAPAVYRFLGELLDSEEQGEALAAYAEKTFQDIDTVTIPEEDKVTVYYGNGEDSLETAPAGSAHAQLFDIVGAVNVATLESSDGSRIQISLEQLLEWNPQYIVVNGEPKSDLSGEGAAEKIMSNPDFATIQAVVDGNVYGAPNAPFSWVDRPPGPNRIVGVRWLAAKLYPEYYTYDVDQEVKEFFSLFYHTDLTDAQLQELYNE